MKEALLYVVLALKQPENKWTVITAPVDRQTAVRNVARQWNLGRLARAVPSKDENEVAA